MVSIVHAVLSAILAIVMVGLSKPLEIGGLNTPNQIVVLNVSCGYFLYDYIACMINDAIQGKFDAMNFFHHLATLSGLATGLVTGRSGAELGLCLILMEVSNPFMHMIHIFRELGMNDSKIADLNKVMRDCSCPPEYAFLSSGWLPAVVVLLLWTAGVREHLHGGSHPAGPPSDVLHGGEQGQPRAGQGWRAGHPGGVAAVVPQDHLNGHPRQAGRQEGAGGGREEARAALGTQVGEGGVGARTRGWLGLGGKERRLVVVLNNVPARRAEKTNRFFTEHIDTLRPWPPHPTSCLGPLDPPPSSEKVR